MSRQIEIPVSETFTLANFISATAYSTSNTSNPVGKTTSNTTYAQINLTRNSNAVTEAFWGFDCSSIPEGATITSVTCSCKCSINNTQSARR